MNAKQFEELLKSLSACSEARQWARRKSLKQVWEECDRGDWLLWLCEQMVGNRGWPTREQIVLIVCDITESVLPSFERKYPDDDRVKNAIIAARAWAECDGNEKIKKAKLAVDAAIVGDAGAIAAVAAAIYAVDAAAVDAATDVYLKRREKKLKEFADMVRKRLIVPWGKD